MSPLTRFFRFCAVGLLLLALGGLGGWSLRVLLAPPTPTETPSSYALVTAENGTLGRTLTLNAEAERPSEATMPAQNEGTLTSLDAVAGTPQQIGDVLYTIDMQPVVLAHGEIPAYRELAEGITGPDVTQLQRFLNTVGEYNLPENGNFGFYTTQAVLDWNKKLGFAEEATIPLGRIFFSSQVPLSLTWAEKIEVGMRLHIGDPVAHTLQSEPRFTMTIPSGQLSLISSGMPAAITMGSSTWNARIGAITIDTATSEARALLVPLDETRSICGEECSLIGVEGAKGLTTSITVVPEVSGVIVPTSALRVDAHAHTVLIDEDAHMIPVDVLTSTQGQSIVSGIEAGTRIRVLNDEGAPPSAQEEQAATPDTESSSSGQGNER